MPSEAASPMTFYSSWFPGEEYLAVNLPGYDRERRQIVCSIIVVVILFIFVLPFFLATSTKTTTSSTGSCPSPKNNGEPTNNNDVQTSSKRCNSKRRKGKKDKLEKQPQSTLHHPGNPANEEETVVEFSAATSNVLTLLCILIILATLFFSNNNLFPARTVLIAPVFTREECRKLIGMAHAAARRNAEEVRRETDSLLLKHPEFMDLELAEWDDKDVSSVDADPHKVKLRKLDSMLREPAGWTKDRHNHYPTTDLNLVTDPFTPEDRAWLANKLNARLAPVVERSFGIFRGSIRANDIFVVRYDATKGQPYLRKHTDSSHLSFNVLLNDEFEGGGTRFHSRQDKSYVDIRPDVGEALISHSQILHEGLATTNGTRYILVGFDSIDEKDPLTGEATNLSIFSSWLNFSWMQVRFKEGFQDSRKSRSRIMNNVGDELKGNWKYSRYAMSLFRDLDNAMTILIDIFAPFRSLKIVDTKDFDKYFEAMDQAMEQQNQAESKQTRSASYASWFGGQQIDLRVFGNFWVIWNSRYDKEDKFRGEDL
eukprot:CAMPEP_0172543076 /NCGR_PEP_ID=MMETSP1067-20121228/13552_1 /TAXON_ID=265564 ORGANISM="Thalassiosira punctigera, Strain Tpunct2005C2" /NCGR_SAMPLE_ID=MMETSP1067 /ASSEMBLY_ACC=CAM_ASM_000444 /LENGTH=539 /DNA_ID=CAMNT_0013329413 /DNA_START=470 /DNA_END=2089 /DNA_ORIENTATION=+